MRRRLLRSAAVFVTFAAVTLVPAETSAVVDEPGPGLSTQDRARVAAAGGGSVTLLVAAKPGRVGEVRSRIERFGGTVGYSDADLDYLRVTLPARQAASAATLSDVDAAALDRMVKLDDPIVTGDMLPVPITPPDASTPAVNPYLPIGDMGAAQFVEDHPTWDGRGTRIAIIDSGVDLSNPVLATTSTGKRKVVDWRNTMDPAIHPDPAWVKTETVVRGPTFTVGGVEYTAPSHGRFKFGLFDERDPRPGPNGGDVNRDGNPPGSSGLFGVLWDGHRRVWVDTDQDRSFADQSPMMEYRYRFDVGRFGTDNPATPVIDQVPFVVTIDAERDWVNIGFPSNPHGSHVAGIAAGHRLFGGAMNGAAPGAELISLHVCFSDGFCPTAGLDAAMIYAAKTARADVINMSIGNQTEFNEGITPSSLLHQRLIRRYGVQIFIASGNFGPGENTLQDLAANPDVVGVGSYVSGATWLHDYGSPTAFADNLHPFSTRGPTEGGGAKPDLVAPGAAVSASVMWLPGGPSLFQAGLPVGYTFMNGTSMAAPAATGAAALLVSAAKQQRMRLTPAQLRQALKSSARFLPRYGAYEQGAGLLNVPSAWEVLRRGVRPVEISAQVPVKTVLSHQLPTPDVGSGIHDREGVTVGQAYTRTYTLRRTSGPAWPVRYGLSWKGNDGTFSTLSSIVLPRGTAVSLPVRVRPATLGAHSALLRFDDPSAPGIEFQTMNTVIAPHEGSFTVSDTIGRNQVRQYFVRVAPGATSFKVDFAGPSATPGTGQARFLRFRPVGLPAEPSVVTSCYSPPPPGGFCLDGSPLSRTVTNPEPGVWELTVEARRTSDVDFTPFTMTATTS